MNCEQYNSTDQSLHSCPSNAANARVNRYPSKEEIMAIAQDLLDMLVCPVCKVPVKLLDNQNGLKCPNCKRVYPVRDEIPVMLPEEATVANE
jgi:uncharacterized protein